MMSHSHHHPLLAHHSSATSRDGGCGVIVDHQHKQPPPQPPAAPTSAASGAAAAVVSHQKMASQTTTSSSSSPSCVAASSSSHLLRLPNKIKKPLPLSSSSSRSFRRASNVENKLVVNCLSSSSSSSFPSASPLAAGDQQQKHQSHHPLLEEDSDGGGGGEHQKTAEQRSPPPVLQLPLMGVTARDGQRNIPFWTSRSSVYTAMFASFVLLCATFSMFNAFSNDDNHKNVDSLLGDDDVITQLISDDDARGYLNRYGYIEEPSSSSREHSVAGEPRVYAQQQHRNTEDLVGELTLDSIRTAVRKFQEFAGLPTTGDLDNRTRKKMAQPRCGIQDVHMLRSGDYVMKWRKRRITFQLMHSSDDIPEHMQKQAIQMAFDTWAKVVPLEFTEATRSDTPDVKVVFARRSHGDPWPFDGRGGVLAHATFPQDGKLHFDDDENWVFMDGRKIGNHRFTDLYWVALHEIGHVLGLSHSNIETAIMAPFYQDPRDLVDWRGNYKKPELTQDDVRAVQQIYGKRYGRLDTSGERSRGIPSSAGGGGGGGGGRRKSANYDDRTGGFWSRLSKLFSTDDDTDEHNSNNRNTHEEEEPYGRTHARRDHHHRHNYEREYGALGNASQHFAKFNLANLIFASLISIIMAQHFIHIY